MTDIYCSSFCNHGHSVKSGKPLDHECYVLPPEAIAFEREGEYEKAIEAISAAKPLRTHSGTRLRAEKK